VITILIMTTIKDYDDDKNNDIIRIILTIPTTTSVEQISNNCEILTVRGRAAP
jgi:hypothetical protein